MILFPNAKINIGLYVTRRRPDGYHDLSTVFYPAMWRDILEIVPARGTSTTLTVTGRAVECPPGKNLVMRAYDALAQYVDLPPVDIYLHKVIPDGAGLGGGSADAAFTLRGLNDMFALGFDNDRLASIAAIIGADCPFFIYNRPMLAGGIGNEFTPLDLDLSGYTLAIVKPCESVSTREAYAGVEPTLPSCELDKALTKPVGEWRNEVSNDFERTVFGSHPAIEQVKSELYDMGAIYASMSGSGAAVYALFEGYEGDRLSERVRHVFNHYDTFVARAVSAP